MASSHASLDSAATERKARLAKLASLKRKQPGSDTADVGDKAASESAEPPSVSDLYLSGRNYDPATRGPRLGFDNAPTDSTTTLEQQADALESQAVEEATKDEAEAEKGIDLFKLQPKKPNWDLKRDLAEKMKILDVRTQNAIARLVRDRIESAKKQAKHTGTPRGESEGDEQGEEVGLDGNTLVESVRVREREEEEDERREDEINEEDGIA